MKRITIIAAAVLMAACAGPAFRPMVDGSTGPNNYEQDLSECQAYARQIAGPGDRAVFGAILGALLGAAIGHKSGIQREIIVTGAAGGALSGAAQGEMSQANVIRRCMRGRGYSVLN